MSILGNCIKKKKHYVRECVSTLLSGRVFVCIFVRLMLFPCSSCPIFNWGGKKRKSSDRQKTLPHMCARGHPSISLVVKSYKQFWPNSVITSPLWQPLGKTRCFDWVFTVVLYTVPRDPFHTLTARIQFCINCCSYLSVVFRCFSRTSVCVYREQRELPGVV